jgi:DNA ligase (NAD+)
MGEKLADNILKSIRNSVETEFWRFINSLGIPDVGKETSKILSKAFSSLNDLIKATEEDLIKIELIGDITAKSICGYFNDPSKIESITTMLNNGVTFQTNIVSDKVYNSTIAITGTFNGLSRKQVISALDLLNIKVVNNVKSGIDGLWVGDKPGASKLEKAKKLNVPIVTDVTISAF